jgi:hypothetical protein
VRQFTYTVYLPGQKKTVQIEELKFNRYKHLVKNITNDNDEIIICFFDELLKDLCIKEENVKNYSFLDKLILLLTIRSVCVSPELELTGTCPETKNTFNFAVKLVDLIDRLQNLNLPEDVYSITKKYNNGNLIVELGMPSILNVGISDLSIINTVIRKIILNNEDVTNVKEEIADHLPATVLKDISDYIDYFGKSLSDVTILSVKSPFAMNEAIEIPLNLFSSSIINFLKICFKRNLMSLYELEYFLVNHLNIDYELIRDATPAELNIYINLFKEEKRQEKDRMSKGNKALNPLQP